MDRHEFAACRKVLGKTQREMAELLATSLKAIHSYEQGWRGIPAHVERQVYFLISRMDSPGESEQPCWEVRGCPDEVRRKCPAWEFGSGQLCWFINGTFCDGTRHKDWQEKMDICRSCSIFKTFLEKLNEHGCGLEPS